MAYITKSSATLLPVGSIVQNATDPEMVEAHTSGTPVGIVMASSDIHDDNGVIIGHEAKVTFGGGDNGVIITPPAGYDGRISRFDVSQNGQVLVVSSGGHGSLVGLNPTWATWGG